MHVNTPVGTRPTGTRPLGTRPVGTRPAGTRPAGTAYEAARRRWVGAYHRELVDTLRETAQRRTRVRVWVRRTTSWI